MYFIALTIAIIVFIAAVVALLAIGKQKRLKAKAQECAKEVQQFQDKLQKLTDPSHFFTDEELLQFKRECAPLLDEINELPSPFAYDFPSAEGLSAATSMMSDALLPKE